jgi:elongation factor P hydroxylase
MASPEADDWRAAIKSELDAMARLDVWEVVLTPTNRALLGTVWVFRKKFDAHGNLVKFKARLCAQGSAQQEGIDFNETYAPTGRSAALRTALTIGVNLGMKIHQMDVRNAFLNGDLDEVIFLRCPQGFSAPPGHCLRLKKSIYGLKQAPRVWYGELSSFFESINFVPLVADPCLFISKDPEWQCLVHVYVDDMAIISHDVDRFKKLVNARFMMDDLGPASSLLGMKISHFDGFITLSQHHHIDELLKEYNLVNARSVPNTRLISASDEEIAQLAALNVNYRRAIGSLNYISVATRPDISFAVSQLSQHLKNPGICHWRAFLHLLRYLSGTKDLSVRLGGGVVSPIKLIKHKKRYIIILKK